MFLMIKIHNKTGLKYLCVTKKENFKDYLGSGIYWVRHLKKHGKNISTILLFDSNNEIEFNKICVFYSILYNVEHSKEWANLVPEYGTLSWKHKNCFVFNAKEKLSLSLKKFWESDKGTTMKEKLSGFMRKQWKENHTKRRKAIKDGFTDDTRKNLSEFQKKRFQNMSKEERRTHNEKASLGRKNMSDEAKKKRAMNYKISLSVSEKAKKWHEREKKERKEGGNPAAKRVFWKGKEFPTKKNFYDWLKNNNMPIKRCLEMLKDPLIKDCYVYESKELIETFVECPYCGKIGGGNKLSAMKRYHFENCKLKEKK